MEWQECVNEAKEELGIKGWTKNWSEVIELAKRKYWDGDNFKTLKENTLENANGECELCTSKERLTAHHIFYGQHEQTICLCKRCHSIIHSPEIRRFGFILQATLLGLCKDDFYMPDNLLEMSIKCHDEIYKKIYNNNNNGN